MDTSLAAYLAATFALVITPGATTTIVMRNAMLHGQRAGAATAVGAAMSNAAHATAAGLGAGLLMQRLPAALLGLRIAGGLYLAWLGAASLRRALRPLHARTTERSATPPRAPAESSSLQQGLFVTLLNPAAPTFYLVVVPSFLPPASGTAAYAGLAVIHLAMAMTCHLGWAFAFSRLRHVAAHRNAVRVLDAGAGLALLYLAARTLTVLFVDEGLSAPAGSTDS